jgi:gamma-glutamylcyclotransferase (GGCT)/AIG2-like uncharacterized protein YtfP
MIEITHPEVIATSGVNKHPIIAYTVNNNNMVNGMVFNVSKAELKQADEYEVEEYKRVNIQLASGVKAWVYVSRDSMVLDSIE